YADSADNVIPGLGAQTVLVRFALLGDANLNNKVDFNDLVLLAQHYGAANANWDQGDFNYDGQVNFDDLTILAQNYSGPSAAPAVVAAAPANAAVIASGTTPKSPKPVSKPARAKFRR